MTEMTCANCGQRLELADKFCRECGLPTPRRAEVMQRQAPVPPPDTQEMKRALDARPEPRPFIRQEPEEAAPEQEVDTTGSVVQATSPTFAASLAASTLITVVAILLLAAGGVVFLILAFR